MSNSFNFSFTSFKNSAAFNSFLPLFFSFEFNAAFKKYVLLTPGITTGYWNDIKIPARALFSGDHSTIDSSLYSISPFDITYPSLPVITFERVLFPEPFRPITAWISPGPMLRSTPFNISFPEIPACSFFTFSISPLQI